MTVCPRHRSVFGARWRCNRTRCTVPSVLAVHGFAGSMGQCGLNSELSAYVLRTTKILIPVGSRMYIVFFSFYKGLIFFSCYSVWQRRFPNDDHK